jgi:hypothetical protein
MRWVLLLLVLAPAANAVPIVPSFKQGTLTSHTETTSKVTETIVSEDFATGYEYSTSGNNIKPDGSINPIANTTINGWTSLGQGPNWSIVNQGEPFQFVQRLTEITSVTDTVSTFSE